MVGRTELRETCTKRSLHNYVAATTARIFQVAYRKKINFHLQRGSMMDFWIFSRHFEALFPMPEFT